MNLTLTKEAYIDFIKLICSDTKNSYLDKNNILYKYVNGKFIGKRSVFTTEYKSCWIEETKPENVKYWWCGKDSDYNEIFEI